MKERSKLYVSKFDWLGLEFGEELEVVKHGPNNFVSVRTLDGRPHRFSYVLLTPDEQSAFFGWLNESNVMDRP